MWIPLVLALLATGPRSGDERAQWKAVAARCGEELCWAGDWEEAARRSREEKKPILAVAWMFDLFQVIDGSRAGFAMDPAVIRLVNERFVPLALHLDTPVPFAARELYGLAPTSLGAALIVAAPDGHVLADSALLQPTAACEFLRSVLASHPEFPGADEPPGLDSEARAARHQARGELDLAEAELGSATSPRATLLRGEILFQRRDPEAALATLRTIGPAVEGGGEARRDELFLLLELDRPKEARALAERLARGEAANSTGEAAELVLGMLDQLEGRIAEARARWSRLVAERPESRWAWQAATLLLAAPAELELGLHLKGPLPALLDALAPVPFERAEAPRARADAIRWLRSRATPRGWPDATELDDSGRYRNHVSMAIDALAARALLAAGEREAAAAGQAVLLAARKDTQAWTGTEAMAYGSWADALWLELVAAQLAAGVGEAAELRALGEDLARELADRQRRNGGWSYFYATSLEEGAATIEQSISFVTATVVLALQHALAAGIELDEDALEQGLDCLESMRDEDGVFTYMLLALQARTAKETQLAGAAGRGPLCEMALYTAGRGELASVRRALERFFEHLPALAAERGKALMHCGAEAQGCHFVLYDYATAAQAIGLLPEEERAGFRARLMEQLLGCRRTDGSFLDAPVLGPTPGTALALLALEELGVDR